MASRMFREMTSFVPQSNWFFPFPCESILPVPNGPDVRPPGAFLAALHWQQVVKRPAFVLHRVGMPDSTCGRPSFSQMLLVVTPTANLMKHCAESQCHGSCGNTIAMLQQRWSWLKLPWLGFSRQVTLAGRRSLGALLSALVCGLHSSAVGTRLLSEAPSKGADICGTRMPAECAAAQRVCINPSVV